jgi:hypothetical protein
MVVKNHLHSSSDVHNSHVGHMYSVHEIRYLDQSWGYIEKIKITSTGIMLLMCVVQQIPHPEYTNTYINVCTVEEQQNINNLIIS